MVDRFSTPKDNSRKRKKLRVGEPRAMGEIDTIIRAFGLDHISRLTGISVSTLRYWDKTGFYSPEHAGTVPIYSFLDVVSLRAIAELRKTHHVPLQHMRKAIAELQKHRNAPWAQLKLYVLNRRVYFQEPETENVRAAVGGQYAVKTIALEVIAQGVASDVRRLKERRPEKIGKIDQARNVMRNAAVVGDTRIPTRTIKHFADAGYSITQILREYPILTEADVKAALEYERRREAA
jgi:DNA-binding transcriptional MerR regulator